MNIGFADIAVFCRVTALTRPIEQAFRSARIPYQVVGGVAFYERQEIKDVLAYLNLMVNPKDDMAFARVVNVPPRGLGKTSIEHLTAAARAAGIPLLAMAREARSVPAIKDKAGRGLEDFARLIDELAALRDRPAEEVIEQLLTRIDYREHLKADTRDNGEDRLANLDELITAAREFDQAHAGASIQDFLAEITLASAIDRWDEDSGAVTLMTLHAAKGLEFPVVFIVALENGLLPHARSGENDNQIEEERRLFFVGITRARRELYLSPVRGEDISRPAASHVSLAVSRRAARGADRGPRPLGRGPIRAIPGRSPPGRGHHIVTNLGRPAAPRDFRLMTAADLAGAAGGIAPRGPAAGESTSIASSRACRWFTPSMAWDGSWPSRARAPAARGGSRSPSAPRGPLFWPSRRCGPWSGPRTEATPRARSRRSRPRLSCPASRLHHPRRNTTMPRLGVNIDHVATLRQVRGGREPDPVWAAVLAELGGADVITIHLREDRRHIQERDLRLLRQTVQVRLNMELAVEPGVIALALEVKPDQATFVPERREELTTEGGLDVVGQRDRVADALARCRDAGIEVALFIDPDPRQVEAAVKLGATAVELHTGRYANAHEGPDRDRELDAPQGRGRHRGHLRTGATRRARPQLPERRRRRPTRSDGGA